MNEDGFIILHRKLLEWEWFQDHNVFRLFVYLLLKANWKDGRFMGVDVPRGSMVTSLEHLALETGLSVQSVRSSLTKLKSTGEITSKSTNKFTLVTVTNYGFYQDGDLKSTSKSTSKSTNHQQTINNNRTIITNKQIYISSTSDDFDAFWKAYPKKVGKQAAIKAFNKIKVGIDTLLAAVEAQKQSNQWQKNSGQYIPNPATWLNQGRWEDELQGAEQPQASYESELERLYG